jgi:hypothetical protein
LGAVRAVAGSVDLYGSPGGAVVGGRGQFEEGDGLCSDAVCLRTVNVAVPDAVGWLAEWSVRDVVDHLVGMNLVFVALLEESPMPAREADRLGADPAGAYHRSAAALQAAAAREHA